MKPAMPTEGIIWSCISRDKTILAEAGEDHSIDGAVTKAARELMKKKPTPGYEFYKKGPYSGVKFHVYEKDPISSELFIWMFCCVHDATVKTDQAQSFLEKILIMTEMNRKNDFEWQYGGVLACQATFAPCLLQRMQEVAYLGRMAMVNEKVDNCKDQMHDNIMLILENEGKIEELGEKATRMEQASHVFKKRSQDIKRFHMWQNAKHGVVVGSLVTAGVAVITVPTMIAIL
jgi:vesicle-associated membrane protein 5